MQATVSRAAIPFALIERLRRDVCQIGLVLFQDTTSTPLNLTGQVFRFKFLRNGVTIVDLADALIVRTAINRLEITLTNAQKELLSLAGEYDVFLYEETMQITFLEGIFRWVKPRPSSAPGLKNPPDIGIVYDSATSVVLRTVLVLQGPPGYQAWQPVHALVNDGNRRVLQVVDWRSGTGTKPTDMPYLGATGYVATLALATDVRGQPGFAAWSPVLSLTADGLRWVLKVSDWIGGEGVKPTINVYLGATGYVSVLANAIDIRGKPGTVWSNTTAAPGAGTGVDGDYHLHSTTGDMYYKLAGAWSMIGNLRGPAGTLTASVLTELLTYLATDKLVVQQADGSLKKIAISLVLPIGPGPSQIPTNNLLGTAAFVSVDSLTTAYGFPAVLTALLPRDSTFTGKNTFSGDTTLKRIIASGSGPSVATGSGIGSGGTASILAGSADMAGTLTLVTGSSPPTNQTLVTLTFSSALAATPKAIVLYARNNVTGMSAARFYINTKTASTWTISSTDVALAGATTYLFDYIVIA